MTPMMFSSGAAGAGPESAAQLADVLGAMQATDGDAPADESGFAAFDVALLAILNQVALSDTDQAPPPTDDAASQSGLPAVGEMSLSGQWMHAYASRTRTSSQSEADAESTAQIGDEPNEIDEAAATIAAMAMTAASPSLQPVAVSSTATLSEVVDGSDTPGQPKVVDATARAGVSATSVSGTGAVSAVATTENSFENSLTGEESPAEDQQSGEASADALEGHIETPASQVHRRQGSTEWLAHLRGRASAAQASAHAAATPASSNPSASVRGEFSAALAASLPTQSASGQPTAAATPAEQDGSPATDLPIENPIGQQHSQMESPLGDRSRDSGQRDHQVAADLAWLRRSATIESQLAAPTSFAVPVTPSPTLSSTPVTTASPVGQPQFAIPEPAENLERLVQSIRVQTREGLSQATVRLNPEHLGEVTIAVRVESGTVTAVVRAEAGDVRQWLRGQEEAIRSSLAEQGLTLDELVVEQDGRRGQEQERQSEEQQRRGRTRAREARGVSFEVTA